MFLYNYWMKLRKSGKSEIANAFHFTAHFFVRKETVFTVQICQFFLLWSDLIMRVISGPQKSARQGTHLLCSITSEFLIKFNRICLIHGSITVRNDICWGHCDNDILIWHKFWSWWLFRLKLLMLYKVPFLATVVQIYFFTSKRKTKKWRFLFLRLASLQAFLARVKKSGVNPFP